MYKTTNYMRGALIIAGIMVFSVVGNAQKVQGNAEIDTAVNKTGSGVTGFLSEKINTAFGRPQQRKLTTSSISSIQSDVLKRTNTPNLGNTLFGRLGGLYVAQTGSAPGNNDNPGLSLRGRQTFQDNGVMVLVDGFETNWSTLMPDEIESVTVMKDAAALALYGADGANGVILITTKRGYDSKKTNVQFSSRFGVHAATVLPEFVNNGDYAELFNKGMISDGKAISSGIFQSDSIVNFYKSGQYPYLYPDVDWQNEMLKNNSLSQDYALTFSGGKPDAKFFVALGYANYQGIYANTERRRTTNSNFDLKRFNLRANFDVAITKFLLANVNFRGILLEKNFPNAAENTLWRTMTLFNPYAVRTADGKWGGKQGSADNPVATILQRGYQSINDRTVDANVKLTGKLDMITKGLQAFGQLNFSNFFYDTYNKTRGYAYDELVPRFDLIVPGVTPPGTIPFDVITRGSTDNNFSITQGNGTQFNRTNILAGLEYDRTFNRNSIYASAIYFQEAYRAAGNELPFAKQRLMGRISYAYDEKYLAEFGYAYSGSENFSKGNRFGFFPSVSAGWVISKEKFMSGSKVVSFLKLRTSAGLLGNDNVGNSGRFIFNQFYAGSGNYLVGNALNINAPTYTQGNLANTTATWEKALRTNIGVDAVLFSKLNISLDYFFERRKDIFLNPSSYIPAVMGATFNNVNKGKTKSHGGEIEIVYNEKVGKVGFSVGGNLSYAANEIVDIAEPVPAAPYLYAKGNPINQPYILTAIGFFKDNADIAASPQQLFGAVRPGDVKYKDQNNDGFIDNNDRTPIGFTTLPELIYGFNASADYAGFDFTVFVQGAANRSVSLLDNGNIIPFLNGGVKPAPWVKDNYWTPERGDAAKFPRLTTEQNDNNYRASTLWQRNGSFIRLRNVELGYTLPKHVADKARLNGVRFYVSGNNLLTIDKISEINVDPEIMNMFVHPALKSFNFGFNVKF
jgi:TonB-linked SusC/RagA family outer membrane protein